MTTITDRQHKVTQFCTRTEAPEWVAVSYLSAEEWCVDDALTSYFADVAWEIDNFPGEPDNNLEQSPETGHFPHDA